MNKHASWEMLAGLTNLDGPPNATRWRARKREVRTLYKYYDA